MCDATVPPLVRKDIKGISEKGSTLYTIFPATIWPLAVTTDRLFFPIRQLEGIDLRGGCPEGQSVAPNNIAANCAGSAPRFSMVTIKVFTSLWRRISSRNSPPPRLERFHVHPIGAHARAMNRKFVCKFPSLPVQCDHPEPDALLFRVADFLRVKPGGAVAEDVRDFPYDGRLPASWRTGQKDPSVHPCLFPFPERPPHVIDPMD